MASITKMTVLSVLEPKNGYFSHYQYNIFILINEHKKMRHQPSRWAQGSQWNREDGKILKKTENMKSKKT